LERIYYRYHPLFDKELEVVRKRDSRSHEERITQLPDGTRCVLPGWMFDESYCSTLVEVETIMISIPSLMQLADLLASQGLGVCSSVHDADTIDRKTSNPARPGRPTVTVSNGERRSGPAERPNPVRRVARRPVNRSGQSRGPRRRQ